MVAKIEISMVTNGISMVAKSNTKEYLVWVWVWVS